MKLLMLALAVPLLLLPLRSDVTVDKSKITVYVEYTADAANSDVTVAVTALDNTPEEWASATVFHVWYINSVAYHFNDEWPNMKAGHFRVQTTLHRDGKPAIEAPSQDVEVK